MAADQKTRSKYYYWVQYKDNATGEVISRYIANRNFDEFIDLDNQKKENYTVIKTLKIVK